MKTFTHISRTIALLLLTLGVHFSSFAQGPEPALKGISAAISQGDAAKLATFFGPSVEITVPGTDNTFSAQQATFVMKEFFAENAVESFKVVHQGNSGSTFYATGTCITGKAEYDTNLFLKKIDDKFKVTQIRFEAE